MESTLFTELTSTEQETLSGGARNGSRRTNNLRQRQSQRQSNRTRQNGASVFGNSTNANLTVQDQDASQFGAIVDAGDDNSDNG